MTTTPRILITTRSFKKMEGPHWDILHAAGFETLTSGLDRTLSAQELTARLPGVAALICGMDDVSEVALAAADELRVILMNGVGLERIDVAAAIRRSIVVTNTPGSNDESVADLTMALMLAQTRSLPSHGRVIRAGGWKRKRGRELRGQRLGLVGLGAVDKAVAVRGAAFGMHVQAYDPTIDVDFCQTHAIKVVDWETILRTSDLLSLHLPTSPETIHLINQENLAMMRPCAILINTARGELVDELALVDSLRSGHLSGAGLDVFLPEPPESSPLLEMDQVVLAPHIGGYTREAVQRTAQQSARNAAAILTDHPEHAHAIVNPEVLHN
jgi:D-3-phosphoglycerate dehydrogenase